MLSLDMYHLLLAKLSMSLCFFITLTEHHPRRLLEEISSYIFKG